MSAVQFKPTLAGAGIGLLVVFSGPKSALPCLKDSARRTGKAVLNRTRRKFGDKMRTIFGAPMNVAE